MQKIISPLHFVGICVVALAAAVLFVWYITNIALAGVTSDRQNNLAHQKNFDFFVATTTTATSTNTTDTLGLDLKGAKKVTLYLSRGDTTGQGNSGSSLFRIQVSPDGTNWYYFNKLVQNLATSTDPTSLSTVTVPAGTSTVIVSPDIRFDAFQFIRCIVIETTDGEHSCSATVEY